MVMRGRKRKGVRYFGPYGHAYAIRETLDLLLRTFPIRTCSRRTSSTATSGSAGRACCSTSRSAPGRASARSTKERYDELVDELHRLPRRRHRRGREASSRREMQDAADELEFERAARLRDRLTAVRKAIEKQQMVADRNEDLDVIGIADDELEAAVQVFYVRKGRVVGRKGFIVDKVEDLDRRRARRPASSRGSTARSRRSACPSRCSCRSSPRTSTLYEEWLSELRGSQVAGPGAAAGRQARRCRRPSPATPRRSSPATGCGGRRDHNSRARALNELQDALGLPEAPLRIECYDMSHIQGTDYVGSMVVHGGRPARKKRVPPLQGEGRRRQRRLRGHGGGAHPPAHRLPGRARPAGRASDRASSPTRRSCCWSTAARASSAWPCGCSRSSGSTTRSRWPRWPSGSRRSSCRAGPTRSGSRASPRRSTCCSASATRPTASPSRYHRELRGKRMTKIGPRRHARPRPDRARSGC